MTNAAAPQRVLAFGTWLEPDKAQAMERAVDALRANGEGFTMQLMTLAGHAIEADGRVIGGRAVLRLRDVSGIKRELAELNARHEKFAGEMESLRALLDALPSPVWARDLAGALVFANPAFARAVEAKDPADAVARGVEMLGRTPRDEASRSRAAGKAYRGARARDRRGQPPHPRRARRADPQGQRRHRHRRDRSRGDARRDQAAARRAPPHARPASDRRRDLRRRPEARVLQFGVSARCGTSMPASSTRRRPIPRVLDQLRAERKLPEEQDFRQWKAALHEAYRATETREHLWHLPDGRTLRVVTTPNPQGGVTYLFEDTTERLDLMRRYGALNRVQGETLDNLAEGVAVFGSDGRLRLHNSAFEQMWQLDPAALAEQPHIEAVIEQCRRLHGDEALWQKLRGAATAIDNREPLTERIERRDGSVIDLRTVPLPDGATLVTFQDITDTVNVERALIEKQRGAGDRRQAQGRFRAPRLLRAALAADQHHRLRAFPRRAGDRRAERQAERISRLHHRRRPTRCSPSSTTSSISPPSTPAR